MGSHSHSKLSPSAATRWLNCPGCISLLEPLPEQPSSVYALEGTAAHYLGEKCLIEEKRAEHLRGQKITVKDDVTEELHRFDCNDDMIKAVQMYLDEIARQKSISMAGSPCLIEERLSAEWLAPHVYGTGDHVLIDPLSCIRVTDYKHGRGVSVDAEDNPQLKIYALGALGKDNPHMVEEVHAMIVQPRAYHAEGPIREVVYKVDELIEWGNDVLAPGAKRALTPGAPLKTGPWCRWCDAKDPIESVGWSGCPEINGSVHENAVKMFGTFDPDKITIADPGELTAQELDKRLALVPVFQTWIAGVTKEAEKRLLNGSPNAPTTKKMVAGKSNRKYRDEAEVEKTVKQYKLEKLAYTEPKLKTPKQLRDSVEAAGLDVKTIIDPLIIKPAGAKTMVDISDPRPALPSNAEKLFEPYVNPLDI